MTLDETPTPDDWRRLAAHSRALAGHPDLIDGERGVLLRAAMHFELDAIIAQLDAGIPLEKVELP